MLDHQGPSGPGHKPAPGQHRQAPEPLGAAPLAGASPGGIGQGIPPSGSGAQAAAILDHWADAAPAPAAGGGPLPGGVRAPMEAAFGADFSDVRIKEGGEAPGLGALAYTQGSDIHFAPGTYNPTSQAGQALLGHELAHVIQQRKGQVARPQAKGAPVVADAALEDEADRAGHAVSRGEPAQISGAGPAGAAQRKSEEQPIQCFGSQEHKSLGDQATAGASYDIGAGGQDHFNLTHGDLIALSGDYFLAEELFKLAKLPGDRGTKKGTRDEIVWAMKLVNAGDPRFKQGGAFAGFVFSDEVKGAVTERYQKLAAANTSHFVAPRGRNGAGDPNPVPASEGSAGGSYRSLHEQAIKMAFAAGKSKTDIGRAMAMEAAAQHYLTDSFSAGHLRTEVGNIREHWGKKYPLFWYNLRHKMALDTAVQMNDQDSNAATSFGTVYQMYKEISGSIEAMAGSLPAVTLGDLLSKMFHDHDNEKGLDIVGGGKVYGDDHLDDKDPKNMTRKLAEASIRAGNRDITQAFQLGQAGQDLTDPALFTAVRAGNGGQGDKYAPEALIPRPAATNPVQNWQANSFEELWNKPITGKTGPTVGDQIKALLTGGEVRSTLDGLAEKFPEAKPIYKLGIYLGTLHPRRAYRDGFLTPLLSDPYKGILSILHWAPNYGLAGDSKDDVSEETARELDRGGQLGGMTLSARVKYVQEMATGSVQTSGGEGDTVVRVFETCPASERRDLYKQVTGYEWNGKIREGFANVGGDLLYRSLTRAQINKVNAAIK